MKTISYGRKPKLKLEYLSNHLSDSTHIAKLGPEDGMAEECYIFSVDRPHGHPPTHQPTHPPLPSIKFTSKLWGP